MAGEVRLAAVVVADIDAADMGAADILEANTGSPAGMQLVARSPGVCL